MPHPVRWERVASNQLILLPYQPEDTNVISTVIGEKHLMFLLPKNHRLAKRKSLTLGDMNGRNRPLPENRISVPITDPEVNVTYYLACKKVNKKRFSTLFTEKNK